MSQNDVCRTAIVQIEFNEPPTPEFGDDNVDARGLWTRELIEGGIRKGLHAMSLNDVVVNILMLQDQRG